MVGSAEIDCAECAAWPGACPAHASFRAGALHAGCVLRIDLDARSGIAAIVDRLARASGIDHQSAVVDALDPVAAAAIVVAKARQVAASLVVLPHTSGGCAVAALAAHALDAPLLAGCDDISADQSGGVRALRSAYGGIVVAEARCPPGMVVVATVHPRTQAIAPSALSARRLAVIAASVDERTATAARSCARSFGAAVVAEKEIAGRQLSPDFCITFGVGGSTETNGALRGSRIVIALVREAGTQIAQIADYVLEGDVAEHAGAIAALL